MHSVWLPFEDCPETTVDTDHGGNTTPLTPCSFSCAGLGLRKASNKAETPLAPALSGGGVRARESLLGCGAPPPPPALPALCKAEHFEWPLNSPLSFGFYLSIAISVGAFTFAKLLLLLRQVCFYFGCISLLF